MMPNPFDHNIVHEPRKIEKAVGGLNEGALARILARFKVLEEGRPPREGRKSPNVAFLTSPEPGYGKSYLIGRLFETLAGRATVVYIRPFVNPDGCWQAILLAAMQEMKFPDRTAEPNKARGGITQIEAFAGGVLTHLTADLVAAGKVGASEPQAAVEYLRRQARGEALSEADAEWEATWKSWMQKNFVWLIKQMPGQLNARGIRLDSAGAGSWLNVLHAIASGNHEGTTADACFDWLCGRPLDEEGAEKLGISPADRPPLESRGEAREDLCRRRLVDLSRLAAFFRPFLLCFDQTENYARSEALGQSLATLLDDLVSLCENMLVLMTANIDAWMKRLKPYFSIGSYLDRIAPPIQLGGISREQAQEMVRHRLEGLPAGPKTEPFLNGEVLDKVYGVQQSMGARAVLSGLRDFWDTAGPKAPRRNLAECHAQYTVEQMSQSARLGFDPEFFRWLTTEAASRWPAVKVEEAKHAPQYLSIQWTTGGKVFCFGFEGGCHWKRWVAINEMAVQQAKRGVVSCFFRTPEQPEIPAATWSSRKDILASMPHALRIIVLPLAEVATLYACRAMFYDAVQGDLEAEYEGKHAGPEEVLKYSAETLAVCWSRWMTGNEARDGKAQVPRTKESLADQIRAIAASEKFMSLEELEARLGGGFRRGEILACIGTISELKTFSGPAMTVILWQAQAPASR